MSVNGAEVVRADVSLKVERVARMLHANDLDAALIVAHHNFAWLTGGRSNRVDGTREAGVASLVVTRDGRLHLLASTIEMPRFAQEELAGWDIEHVEYPWTDEQGDPDLVGALAQRI